jgi:hypothetical protein
MWTTDREDITVTGWVAAGRPGSFNQEEQRSSRFLSYGPPLREERLRSSVTTLAPQKVTLQMVPAGRRIGIN